MRWLRIRRRRVRLRGGVALGTISLAVIILVAFLATPTVMGCKGSARCYRDRVGAIVDGDTLDVGDHRIRLALVDTPEVGEAGYDEARRFTADLCPVSSEALVDEDDGQTGGSFGRIVAAVTCGGRNLNEALLEAGHAIVLTEFCAVSEFATEPWAAGC